MPFRLRHEPNRQVIVSFDGPPNGILCTIARHDDEHDGPSFGIDPVSEPVAGKYAINNDQIVQVDTDDIIEACSGDRQLYHALWVLACLRTATEFQHAAMHGPCPVCLRAWPEFLVELYEKIAVAIEEQEGA